MLWQVAIGSERDGIQVIYCQRREILRDAAQRKELRVPDKAAFEVVDQV